MAIIKLQTNVPAAGDIASAIHQDGNYGPQILLRFTNNDILYVSTIVGDKLANLGVLRQAGLDPSNNPTYQVLTPGARLRFLKTEDGQKKHINVEVISQGALLPAPQASSQPAYNGAPAQNAMPQAGASQAQADATTWARLKATMAKCIEFAQGAWPEGWDKQVIGNTAHSLFIACNQKNVLASLPPKPASPEQKEQIDKMVVSLGWIDTDFQKALTHLAIPSIEKITDSEAARMIGHLRQTISLKEEAARQAALPQGQLPLGGEQIPW